MYLRDLFGGSELEDMSDMPNLLIIGHFHTLYEGKDHGIYILQPGSFQDSENDYCVSKGLTGPNGMFLVDMDVKDGYINEFRTNYIQPEIVKKESGHALIDKISRYR